MHSAHDTTGTLTRWVGPTAILLATTLACGHDAGREDREAAGAWGTAQVLGDGYDVRVAVDRDLGSAVAVWIAGQFPRGRLSARHLHRRSGWGSPEAVASDAAYFALHTAPGGRALLAWNETTPSGGLVRALWFRPDTGWSGTALLSSAASADQSRDASSAQPSVATGGHGGGWVAWRQIDGGLHRIWVVRDAAPGSVPAAEVAATGEGNASRVRLRVDERGNALVVWWAHAAGLNHVRAVRFVAGRGWGEVVTLWTDPGHDQSFSRPEVALTPAGDGLVTWTAVTGAREPGQVWIARLDAVSGWEAPRQIGPTLALAPGDTPASLPRAEMDGRGSAWVVWRQFSVSAACTGDEIWTNRFTPSGGWERPSRLDACPGYPPAVAVNTSGTALAAWFRGSPPRVWSSRYDPAAGWDAPVAVDLAPAPFLPSAPDLGIDASGNAVLVWSQQDTSQVWVNRYTARPF